MKSVYIGLIIFCVNLALSTVFEVPQSVGIYYRIKRDPKERISSYPYITGDTFRAIADHIFDETNIPLDISRMKAGDIVFINPAYGEYFFEHVHPEITEPYIIVTHNNIHTMPGKFIHYLDDKKIVAWFAKNVGIRHPKLFGLPIGFANRYWPHGDCSLVETVSEDQRNSQKKLLYLNLDIKTHSSRRDLMRRFKDKPFVLYASKKPFDAYLKDMAKCKFVLSPRGAGIDCHRTWEALMLGCIPIVPSTSINGLYDGLPVLVVDDWSIITESFLKEKWREMRSRIYHYGRLYAPYWIHKIHEVKDNFLAKRLKPNE